ncbi:hypothetical protein BDV12DRAFT_200413 [Aspergillus spectabilis]
MRSHNPSQTPSILDAIDTCRVRLYACCGGQGPNNLTGLDELVHLSHTYQEYPPIQRLIDSASWRLNALSSIPHRSCFFSGRSFPLQTWLNDSAASAPSSDELALSPYSFPINTLLSLLHYAITACSLRLEPTQLRDRLHGVIGHSQGVFAGAAISRAGAGWQAFYHAADLALQLSFWVGLESHVTASGSTLSAEEVMDSLEHREGTPSYLLGVTGIDVEDVSRLVQQLNSGEHVNNFITLSLINGHAKCVLAGSPQTLRRVCLALRRVKAPQTLDQSRVPFNRRRPDIDVQFLPVSAPYHSSLLGSVEPYVRNALLDLRLTGDDMNIPIYCPIAGTIINLQAHGSKDILSPLVRAVTVEPVDWPETCSQMHGATHILSFGPGAVGNLVHDTLEGTGARIIHLSGRSLRSGLNSMAMPDIPPGHDWSREYRPHLRNTGDHVEPYVETKMTRLLGTPSVMVAGMTPTTCSPEFVAAIMQAGYHVEFACGGYHNRASMDIALRQLAATIPVHRSITCNVIYASPKSLSWQIELLRDLIEEGLPVEGLTVGAGIPSPEVVREWIERLGLSHIWFKPGSVDAIDRVLTIARRHPTFPVGLQWTGGRAGGHHSCEDFHQPILERYARIRECDNVIVVAGSGFGGAEDTWPYLSGLWSVERGFPPMPFDGILLGSRMMVAREARTSLPAKKLIVEAHGIEDDDDNHGAWTECERQAKGGVISVISEMGQPIHVLANRGMCLWHEFDRRFFSIRDPERLKAALQLNRTEIITRLNHDYAKPWFAMTDNDQPVEIEDLSYRQVFRRLCKLMYVGHQSRWVDSSYLDLVHDFLRLVHSRFGSSFKLSSELEELQIDFDTTYGILADRILYPADAALLIALFRRQGRKPVPFIPCLDADFETWFKKDSLWQSEDIEAVVGQDAERVCIIQGPVATKHSTSCDEPVGKIIDQICQGHVEMLHKQVPADEDEKEESNPQNSLTLPGVQTSSDGSICRYHLLGPALPSSEAIIEQLVNGCNWARAALANRNIIFGRRRVKNPIRSAFHPEIGDIVEVKTAQGYVSEITLYTCNSSDGTSKEISSALELVQLTTGEVSVTLLTRATHGVMKERPSLEFKMRILGGPMGHNILQVDAGEYLGQIRGLYAELWIGGCGLSHSSVGLHSEFTGDCMTITAEDVNDFLAVIRQASPARCRAWDAQGPIVPLEYGVVVAWTVLTKPVLLSALDGDPLQLLHQSISIRCVRGIRQLQIGDVVTTSSRITERTITPHGQRIEVTADIVRDAKPVMQIKSVFVIQRRPQEVYPQQFRSVDESDMVMQVQSPLELQVLVSRKWLFLDGRSTDLLGKTLVFRLNTQTVYDASGAPSSLQVTGTVTLLPDHGPSTSTLGRKVGRVYLEEEEYRVNAVMDFLNRFGKPRVQRQMLKTPGWTGDAVIPFVAPSQSESYAAVSKDTNPIHTCRLFARFAGLDQRVLHGMHLSATVRRILEWLVGDTQRSRFHGWAASFDGIVRTDECLRMEVQHRDMEEGLMVVHVKVYNENTGSQVMHAEALLEQAQTAYVFTGQGTQEKGMGMDLYGTSKAAQLIWDRAERHFESQYGLSLLHIVRDNPKSLTVNFGTKRGRQIRGNYLAMMSGSESDRQMLPGLTPASKSYTFSYPPGLLMSTQFAQPALAVMEMAEYGHLEAQGVVQTPALFAGHSLGEYSALGACSTFMPFECFLSLILYRGLKMQNALPRDSNGRTDYGMMAVDPSRVRSDFSEGDLVDLVQAVSKETGLLLEIVNHNIQSRQYVCAGHIRALCMMRNICDDLSQIAALDSAKLIKELIDRHVCNAQSANNQAPLTRGRATIPLAGVDIPFHSQMLRGHIDDYRQYLRRHLRISDVKPEELVGRWVPNVVGLPFAVDTGYVRLVQEVTKSQPLRELLQRIGEEV